MVLEHPNKLLDRSHLRRPLFDTVDQLLREGPKAYQNMRETLIDPQSVNPGSLRQIAELQFETTLINPDGEIVLITGDKYSGEPPFRKQERDSIGAFAATAQYHERVRRAPWTLHNHPSQFRNAHRLSAGDNNVSSRWYKGSDIDMLVTRKGMLFFRYEGDKVLKDRRYLYYTLPERMIRNKQIREGIIRADVPWSDREKILKACEMIRGEIRWEEAQKTICSQSSNER